MATGLRAAALAATQPAEAPQDFGNPLYARTMLAQTTRIAGNAAKFAGRFGLPTEGLASGLEAAAGAIEGDPETGVVADVARGVASLPVAPLAFLSEGEQAAQAAEKEGASPNQALAIGSGVGLASGALEMALPMGLGKVLVRGGKTGLRAMAMGALKAAGIEGATEGVQQVLQNAVPAAYQGDASRLAEGVPYAAGVGALVGGGTGGVTAGVAGIPDIALPPEAQPALRPVAATPEAVQAALALLPEAQTAPPGITPAERDMAIFEQVQDLTPEQLDAEVENARGAEMRDFIAVFGSEAEAKRYQNAVRGQDSMDPNARDRSIATIESMESRLSEAQQARLYGTDGSLIIQPEDVRPYRDAAYDIDGATDIELSREAGLAMTKLPIEGKDRSKWDERERVAAFTFRRAMAEAQSRGLDMNEFKKNAMKAGASRFSDPVDAEFMLSRFLPKDQPPQEAAPRALLPPVQRQLPPVTEIPTETVVAPPSSTPEYQPAAEMGMLRRGGDWSTPLIDRVERQGGSVGAEFADRARLASDLAGALRGRWQISTKPIRQSLRGFPGQRKVRKELNQRTEVVAQDTSGPLASYGYSRFQQAMENDDALGSLTPQAQKAVKSFRKVMEKTAADIAAVPTPEGGRILMQTEEGLIPFGGAEGGKRLIRQWTPELWEIMQAGDQSPAFRALGQALAEANDLSEDVALEALNGIRQQVVEKQSAVEVARTLKQFPSFMRLRNGAEVPLLQTDPMVAATSIVDSLSKRVGYISQFGQNNDGKSLGEQLRESFVRSGGEQVDADNVLRALQGMPVDNPAARLRPGTDAFDAMRVYDAVRTVGNAGLLTRSFIPNIFEPLAKTPVIGGVKNAAKAAGQMVRLVADPKFRESALNDIEQRGWHTVDIMDWMMTPGRKLESAARMVGQVATAPARLVNELNDIHASLTARNWLSSLEQGKGGEVDKARLELLQFTPDQVATVMAGNPTPETAPLFNAVGRRLVSYAQGSTSMPAELSRAANSRNYQRVIAFDRYAQFTANRFNRSLQAVVQAKTPGAKAKQAALLGQLVLGSTASGVASKMLTALMVDGVVGLEDLIRGATVGDDDKEKAKAFAEFLADATRYTMLGGGADAMYRAANAPTATGMAETAVRATVPGRYIMDLKNWYEGDGPYKNMATMEASLKMLERNLPIAPVVRQVAAETGLGGKDIRREVAIRRAWQFVRENEGVGTSGVASDPMESVADRQAKTREFGIAMKRVEQAIRKGNMEDVPKLRAEAVRKAMMTGKDARASLLGRRIIPNINVANRDIARRWMGEKNWKALEQYDALLGQYAASFPKISGGKK